VCRAALARIAAEDKATEDLAERSGLGGWVALASTLEARVAERRILMIAGLLADV
jgi:hypothetical protein